MKKSLIAHNRIIPAILIIALFLSGIFTLLSINSLQGNARVINYTGVVRGATQRLVKSEMNGQPKDDLVVKIDGILSELQTGQGKNDLIKLRDEKFQDKLSQMQNQWAVIKEEITSIRNGKESDTLFTLSEDYFITADEAVSLAEQYAERSVGFAKVALTGMNLAFLVLAGLLAAYVSLHNKKQKKLEEQKQENQEKSDYLSKMFQELRAPMNEISELAYISDIDNYELLFLNDAGKKMFGVEDYKGQKCYKVLQGFDSPCSFCTTPLLRVDQNYTWEYTNPVVQRHYIIKDRLIEWDGKLARLEIAFDATEAEQEKLELKNTLDAQKMVMECIRELYEEHHLDVAVHYVLQQLGSFLKAERAYIFTINEDIAYNTYEWCSDGTNSEKDNLQGLPISLLRRWLSIFKRQECVIMPDLEAIRETDQEEYEVLSAQGIKSLIAAPLEQDGKISGFIGVDNPPFDKVKNIISFLQTIRYFVMLAYRRNESDQKLSNLSYHDTLTSFYNRNRYIQDVDHLCTRNEPLGIVFLDVNGLKEINDRLGHAYGDQALIECADSIRSVFKTADLYRIGGDEFVVICRNISEQYFFDRIRELKQRFKNATICQAAIGSKWAGNTEHLQEVIAEADANMYEDKKRFYHENPVTKRYRHHSDEVLTLADPKVLQEKICENKFVVYLQPKISINDRKVVGAEALIRYQPRKDSVMLPGNFLPYLEETQAVGQVDFFVFEFVCSKIAEWIRLGKQILPISVNFSRCTLAEPDFEERLKSICRQHGVSPDYLEIEVTEDGKVADDIGFKNLVARVRDAGFSVSIDDFGTEYANIALLASVDFDVLKIDKVLIDDIVNSEKGKSIIQSIVKFCNQMNIRLIAEGIETEEQLEVLKDCGVNVTQGFLFSKPIPAEEYETRFLE